MIDVDAWDVVWDDDHDAYTMRFDQAGLSPSVAVAVILETALDADTGPLFDYVDPDALDAIVAGPEPTVTVTFDVDGATVTVHGDGRVLARP
jgi:hypothetical protein